MSSDVMSNTIALVTVIWSSLYLLDGAINLDKWKIQMPICSLQDGIM